MAGNRGGECGPLQNETRMDQTERGLAGETGKARKIHRDLVQRVSHRNVTLDTPWSFEYTEARYFCVPTRCQPATF